MGDANSAPSETVTWCRRGRVTRVSGGRGGENEKPGRFGFEIEEGEARECVPREKMRGQR